MTLLINYFTWCQKLGLIFLSPQLLVHDLFIAIILVCEGPAPSCHSYSGFLQLQVFMYLTAHSVLKPVGWDQWELMARGATVIPKVLAGEDLDAPVLIFDKSDPVSGTHKVLVWFKTVPSGFSPACSVKGAVLPCHRVIIFHW